MAVRENRWTVDTVRCMDCDSTFNPGRLDHDVNRQVGSGNRFMLVIMPETCPNCGNLKPVPQEPKP